MTVARCTVWNRGSIFKLTPPAVAGGAWTQTVIHRFRGGKEGARPSSLIYSNGALYGTTPSWSDVNSFAPTVFQLTPPSGGTGAWTITTLCAFPSGDTSGELPEGLMMLDGNLFGISLSGGLGLGTIFEVKL